MTEAARFDVLGIGNAIVDVMARADEDFLVAEGLTKGSMHLVDAKRAELIYQRIGPATESSGGSAGNTVAGIASLGGHAAFLGKVAADQLGKIYRHDMKAIGVEYDTLALDDGTPTGRSIVLVTPDGERTMNTFLGAAQALSPDDVDPAKIAAASIIFLEGYLWDPPEAKAAFRRAAELAHGSGRKVALTLSDAFCVNRYRDEFLDLIQSRAVDIVLANVAELKSLYRTVDLDAGLEALRGDATMATVTASAEGSYVVTPAGIEHVPATEIDRVIDATGAGDLFAAGFLLGLARGRPPASAAALGSFAAAEVISHMGARPMISLEAAARQEGFSL